MARILVVEATYVSGRITGHWDLKLACGHTQRVYARSRSGGKKLGSKSKAKDALPAPRYVLRCPKCWVASVWDTMYKRK